MTIEETISFNEAVKETIEKILQDPVRTNHRIEGDPYTRALWAAVSVLPKDSHERSALAYLARNPGAFIILDKGDKVVNNGLRWALKLL